MEDLEIQEIESKKRSLKRYKKSIAKINRLEEKLLELDSRIKSAKSPNYSGMPRGGTPLTMDDLIAEKEELMERIARQKLRAREYRGEIIEEIDELENTKHIDVLEMFFIECKTIEEISDELYLNVRSVYRLYSEGIKLLTLKDH